jgi:cyclohexanecarboxylate-CoA ligase
LAYKGALMAAAHGLTPEDVVLMPAPLAHVSGLLNAVLVPAAAGMRVVLLQRWSAELALELVEREGVTFMVGPPTYFVQMRAEPGFAPSRVASLRLLSCGGAGVTADFARETADVFGCVVKRTYGSTEAPTVTTSYAGDPPDRGWETDGRPVGDVELRVDAEELLVRGSELFSAYDDGTGRDAEGWFRTGDRARVDEDGWLVCLGRLGDTIIRGGENVDPAEVEVVCARLPGVRQAVVVGVPDPVMGERVGLVVVADSAPSSELVREHCAREGLARFKTPEVVLAVRELPTLTVGKPDKATLRGLLTAASAAPPGLSPGRAR